MNIKKLSNVGLTFIAVSLLTACGGGGSNNSETIIDQNSVNNTVNIDNNFNNDGNTDTKEPDNTSIPTTGGNGVYPLLSLSGSNPQYISVGSTFIDQGATASDAIDGNLTSSITESNNVNTSVAACYAQTYVVSNTSSFSDTRTRTILVGTDNERHSPNSAPITQEISISNNYNSISEINLLNSAYDANCDTLTVTNVSTPIVGTAKLNSNGTVTFDPQGNVGSHAFTYTVSDSYGGISTSGVSIASIDPNDGNDNWPVITGETVSTPKNTSILIDVLANDYDDDGDVLVLDGVDTPAHGTIQKQNGKVYYTPDINFTGNDFFYYGVHDNHGHNGSGLTNIIVTD